MKPDGHITVEQVVELSNKDKKLLAKHLRSSFDNPHISKSESAKLVSFFERHKLPDWEEVKQDYHTTFEL